MPEVADSLRPDGRDDQDRGGERLRPSQRRALDELVRGRTEALGGHLLPCDHGGQEPYLSPSCRHRSCPKCHRHDTEVWLEERRQEHLPVPSCHVVFPLPQARRERVRRHQKALYDTVLRAAAQALLTRAADPHDGAA
jgi:hypothetical protein